MGPKKATKIAKGRFAKLMVWRGTKEKTNGGFTKDKLMKNKAGKLVTKAQSRKGKKSYHRISGWTAAISKARKELKIKDFCPVGGKTAEGQALYAKAKSFYRKG